MKTSQNTFRRTKKLVPTRQAAQSLGLSVSFMNKHRDELPGKYRAGRVYRWDLDELLTWLRRRAQEGGPDAA